METTNQFNQEEQVGNFANINANDQGSNYNEPGDDAANQEDYPETGNETQTGAATDNDLLETDDDDNLDNDDDLTDIDDELDDDELDGDNELDDESANDADGNGGYPDAANVTETNS
jgi:hypothetical protein